MKYKTEPTNPSLSFFIFYSIVMYSSISYPVFISFIYFNSISKIKAGEVNERSTNI